MPWDKAMVPDWSGSPSEPWKPRPPFAGLCCLNTPEPGPWTAGVDDAADPRMIRSMREIRDKLSHKMPLDDFIRAVKASMQIDSRTMLGGDIQRCLLANAAHRLAILGKQIDPEAAWRPRGLARLKDAWAVFRGRAVVTYIKGSE